MHRIIGLAAVARSGKDTTAAIIMSKPGVAAYALADPLKAGCQSLFGLSEAQAWDDSLKEVQIETWKRSPRQLFQQIGTEWMRGYNPNFWLMRALRELELGSDTEQEATQDQTIDEQAVIKEAVRAFFGFSSHQMFDSVAFSTIDPFWKVSPEQSCELIERLTFEAFPEWVKQRNSLPLHSIKTKRFLVPGARTIILKDIRFENEADFIRSRNGQIWHIIRPKNDSKVNPHSSEAGIMRSANDKVIINDGSLEDLKNKVDKLWQQLQLES